MKQPVSSLRQWMLEQYAPQFHLEKKTLLKQLDQVGFYAERCLPPVGQRVNCQLVLNTCRLYLQTLCPEPPEGWLAFLYEEKLKVLIVEMKAELAELKRQKAEGTLPLQEIEKDKKKDRKKAR